MKEKLSLLRKLKKKSSMNFNESTNIDLFTLASRELINLREMVGCRMTQNLTFYGPTMAKQSFLLDGKCGSNLYCFDLEYEILEFWPLENSKCMVLSHQIGEWGSGQRPFQISVFQYLFLDSKLQVFY